MGQWQQRSYRGAWPGLCRLAGGTASDLWTVVRRFLLNGRVSG